MKLNKYRVWQQLAAIIYFLNKFVYLENIKSIGGHALRKAQVGRYLNFG